MPARLGHLLSVFAEDHSLIHELHERLGRGDVAEIEKDLVPESRVEEVKHRVLRAADVKINGHPVFFFVLGDERLIVVGSM